MEVIEHYKKKLLRHIEDPDTVLYCLKKLDAVPVTIEILQDSEVGKIVNRLKKRTDTTPDVISSSKALVEKWKELVKNADEADEAQKPQKVAVKERPEAVASSSSKSKIPSDERNSSSSSSKNHHGHQKKEKKEKHKEEKKEKQRDKSEKSSERSEKSGSHHKHHKSHKSSSSSKDKQIAEVSSNGSSSKSASNNGNLFEIPADINPNYKPPTVRQRYSDQQTQPQQPSSANTNPHIRNGNGFQNEKSKMETDDDAITVMIKNAKSDRNRTAVYSGRKTSAFSQHEKFPSLIQLCVHVLQDNVSRIDECGNLPYEMLKPILERGKPEDMMRIEDYNPRLMEDTGDLWEKIVKKKFPKGDRQEFESYREMYERHVQEREEKYEKLMGKFATSYASLKTNNRQTKLTYIDSAAKVPRGVKRAQEKNGTFIPMVGSSLEAKNINLVKKARMTAPGSANTHTASAPSAREPREAPKKSKVAPMMAKTLKLARGLKTGGFRR